MLWPWSWHWWRCCAGERHDDETSIEEFLPALQVAEVEERWVIKTMIRLLVPFLLLLPAVAGLFLLLRSHPSTSAGETQEQAFEVAINGGTMSPEETSVEEGDRVTLRIIADEPLEFRVHGYNLEEVVEPDQPAELAFDATTTGRFEIENPLTDSVLGTLLVQPR